jgi:hypothetical protein
MSNGIVLRLTHGRCEKATPMPPPLPMHAVLHAESLYVNSQEYSHLLRAAGAVGLNAATGYDETQYYVSLPVNQAELWFALEAERFQRPAFRQFHSERLVILEERRQRVDSSPSGLFNERFQVRCSPEYFNDKPALLSLETRARNWSACTRQCCC